MPVWARLKQWLLVALTADDAAIEAPPPKIKTQFSATVFSGEADQWVSYLGLPRDDRYDRAVRVALFWSAKNCVLHFRSENESSAPLAACLNQCVQAAREKARTKPFVQRAWDDLVFGNASNGLTDLYLRVSPTLPSEASREVSVDDSLGAVETTIVLQSSVVETVLRDVAAAGPRTTSEEKLGLGFPLLRRVLSQLGYPSYPRDRYVEKIDLMTRLCLLQVNLLYDQKSQGRLVPNRAGELYHRFVSRRDEIKEKHLFDQHPLFRLLNELSFLLEEKGQAASQTEAKILVREYLDGRYLRLSLSGIMPEITAAMAPMPLKWQNGRVLTPPPRLGRFGILDADDLTAWKQVAAPFADLGFWLVRQLGMGEYGRVYEAINQGNPHIPQRVAVKVDRIPKGEKKKVIQAAEVTMQIGRDLAASPHVIRVYDAGKLKGKKYTYHVIQLVDGDTLDNLVGITGTEHSSVHRPERPWDSADEIEREYLQAMRRSPGEAWRRRRLALPFTDAVTLHQLLDLLTSILLWMEEIHALGYAVNDLKNGNLMVSRRGQLKGIDMDSYGPLVSKMGRMPDFFFLAPSLLLLLLNAPYQEELRQVDAEAFLASPNALRGALRHSWPFGDVAEISRGRVATDDVIEMIVDLIHRSRNRTYVDDAERFSADIDRLIYLKRSIFIEEIVLD